MVPNIVVVSRVDMDGDVQWASCHSLLIERAAIFKHKMQLTAISCHGRAVFQ